MTTVTLFLVAIALVATTVAHLVAMFILYRNKKLGNV